jgi:hypothetical protein
MSRLKIDSPRVPQIARSPERKDVSIAVPRREVAPQRRVVDSFESSAAQKPQSAGGLWEGRGTETAGVKAPLPTKLEPHRAAMDQVIDGIVSQVRSQTEPTSPKALKKLLRTGFAEAGLPKNLIGRAVNRYGLPEASRKFAGDVGTSGSKDHPWSMLRMEVRTSLDGSAGKIATELDNLKFGQLKKAVNQAVKESGAQGQEKKLAKAYLFFKLGELSAQGPSPAPTPDKPFRILPHEEPQFVGRPVEEQPFRILPHEEPQFVGRPVEEKPFRILPHDEPQFVGRPVEEKPLQGRPVEEDSL